MWRTVLGRPPSHPGKPSTGRSPEEQPGAGLVRLQKLPGTVPLESRDRLVDAVEGYEPRWE